MHMEPCPRAAVPALAAVASDHGAALAGRDRLPDVANTARAEIDDLGVGLRGRELFGAHLDVRVT